MAETRGVKKGQKRGPYKKKEEEKKEDKSLKFNPIFEPLFYDNLDDPRYYQVYGGRGSGKSFAVSVAMVLKTYSKYKHKILYLRQTMVSSEDSCIADIREAIGLLGLQEDFREVKGTITNIKTGSKIIFKGIRTPGKQTAKLKSLSGITTLCIEEAEEVESFEEFSKVDESIRVNGKPLKVILMYNPGSALNSWIHKEWFTNGRPMRDRTDTMYMHSTYLDNKENLNPSIVERYEALKETNPIYYINVILAEWTLETDGRVYDGWEMYDKMDSEGDVWYGMDFGYGGNDKTSLVRINFFEGKYYIELVFSKSKMKIRHILREMVKNRIPFNAEIFCDSAMPIMIGEIQDGGYRGARACRKGKVEDEIKKVQDKFIVLLGGTNTDLYLAYQTFARDKDGKLPHEPDELAATRYGINSKRPETNARRRGAKKPRRLPRMPKLRGYN